MKKLFALVATALLTLTVSISADAADPFDTKWGKFTAVSFNGSGSDVIQLSKPLKAGMLVAVADGDSNFIIQSLDSKLGTKELLVNEIGAFTGSKTFGLSYSSGKTYGFSVEAEGSWQITLRPLSKAPALPKKGSGSGVFKLTNSARKILKITHDGESNFIVEQDCTNGSSDLVINKIGSFSGKKILNSGKCIVQITADGNWTVK